MRIYQLSAGRLWPAPSSSHEIIRHANCLTAALMSQERTELQVVWTPQAEELQLDLDRPRLMRSRGFCALKFIGNTCKDNGL